ncbi:deoxynucleotide monophosphate kinase [Rhizobium sp.]|uniref:deoxynucleotide monophosphate kinase family protein n=1 Tax=Rhizobium sp. TaxID=391 RepID=UPI003F824057
MTEKAIPLWTPSGDLTTVPAANDNIPAELRPLAAAIGKYPEGIPQVTMTADIPANDNLPPVVAFTGVAGSGKSTATRYLVERHGYTLVKFAGPLKDMMRLIGLTEEEIEGSLKEKPCNLLSGKTPRHAMQTLGTEWGRDCIGDGFWINLWRERVVDILAQAGRVVTDDCRFPNEAQAIRRLGGDIYKIEGRGGIVGGHISEKGCGDQDMEIVNDGSIEELHKRVDEALRRFG